MQILTVTLLTVLTTPVLTAPFPAAPTATAAELSSQDRTHDPGFVIYPPAAPGQACVPRTGILALPSLYTESCSNIPALARSGSFLWPPNDPTARAVFYYGTDCRGNKKVREFSQDRAGWKVDTVEAIPPNADKLTEDEREDLEEEEEDTGQKLIFNHTRYLVETPADNVGDDWRQGNLVKWGREIVYSPRWEMERMKALNTTRACIGPVWRYELGKEVDSAGSVWMGPGSSRPPGGWPVKPAEWKG